MRGWKAEEQEYPRIADSASDAEMRKYGAAPTQGRYLSPVAGCAEHRPALGALAAVAVEVLDDGEAVLFVERHVFGLLGLEIGVATLAVRAPQERRT